MAALAASTGALSRGFPEQAGKLYRCEMSSSFYALAGLAGALTSGFVWFRKFATYLRCGSCGTKNDLAEMPCHSCGAYALTLGTVDGARVAECRNCGKYTMLSVACVNCKSLLLMPRERRKRGYRPRCE